MTPFSMFLALQPILQVEWQLSNTASGWISSAYYAGYMLAVPVLASLTDHFDARSVWLTAITFAAVAAITFATLANGPVTAVLCQALAGAGLAGTYMPGLKLMGDRIATALHPRQIAFYTTSFSLGASGSYFLVGQLVQDLPWRTAIVVAVSGPLIAWALIYFALDHVPPAATHTERDVSSARWRDVLRSSDTMRYVAAYACHMWELFGMRAWLVPFLVFCATLNGPTFAAPTTLAALLALAGIPSSFVGAELSARFGPRRVVMAIMLLSAVVGITVGVTTSRAWTLILSVSLIHSALVMADPSALTSGLVTVAPLQSRGTAMAVYSMGGFGAAALASFATGMVLDALGGQSVMSWSLAFVVMVGANLVGMMILGQGR